MPRTVQPRREDELLPPPVRPVSREILTNFINVFVGCRQGRRVRKGGVPMGRGFHFHVAALGMFAGQDGGVFDGGVRVFAAVEGTGAGATGRFLHVVCKTRAGGRPLSTHAGGLRGGGRGGWGF